MVAISKLRALMTLQAVADPAEAVQLAKQLPEEAPATNEE
jgi:hypothetical protein